MIDISYLPEEKKFYTIREVARICDIPDYVLRYWEKEFKFLRPQRLNSGHRRYTRDDLVLIARIKELLYEKKFTIAGARKQLIKERKQKSEQLNLELHQTTAAVNLIKEIKKEIADLIALLESKSS